MSYIKSLKITYGIQTVIGVILMLWGTFSLAIIEYGLSVEHRGRRVHRRNGDRQYFKISKGES